MGKRKVTTQFKASEDGRITPAPAAATGAFTSRTRQNIMPIQGPWRLLSSHPVPGAIGQRGSGLVFLPHGLLGGATKRRR